MLKRNGPVVKSVESVLANQLCVQANSASNPQRDGK